METTHGEAMESRAPFRERILAFTATKYPALLELAKMKFESMHRVKELSDLQKELLTFEGAETTDAVLKRDMKGHTAGLAADSQRQRKFVLAGQSDWEIAREAAEKRDPVQLREWEEMWNSEVEIEGQKKN